MARIRTFIAVEISAENRARASQLVKRLKQSEVHASWVKPENLHLTLKFLGDVHDTLLPDVCRAAERAAARFEPFQVALRQAGAFPRHEHPRTVWIGVHQGAEQLRALQQALEDELYEAGLPRERRKFVPHMTIGRVRAGGPAQRALGELILAEQDFEAGEVIVEEMIIFASYPDSDGPQYQVLGRAELPD